METAFSILKFIGTALSNLDFPALVLMLLFLMGAWVLKKTQQNPANDFDFADMLRDEAGKPSAARLAVFVCLGITSWAFMYQLIHDGKIDAWIFLGYTAIWSGAKVAEKLVDAYSGRATAALKSDQEQQK